MWLYHDEMGSQKSSTLGLNKMEIRIPSLTLVPLAIYLFAWLWSCSSIQKSPTLGLNKMEIRIPSDSKLLPIFFECPISDCVDQPRVTDSALVEIEQFARPKFD